MRTIWDRWRFGLRSRLRAVTWEIPGSTITASGLKRSRTLRMGLIERRVGW